MKKYYFIIVLCLGFIFKNYANTVLQEAEKAYDSKNYKLAITKYESLVKDGFKSYQLYFNLGNSYLRNNDIGKSIYYYELARKINPNDEDIRINLGIAASKTTDKIDAKENFFISAVKSNILTSFSTSTWALLTIIASVLFCLLVFTFFFSSSVAAKRFSFLLGCLFLITLAITYSLGYSAVNAKKENKFAIVLAKEIKILNEPTTSATTKFNLHEGTKVRVVENNGTWLLIKLDNGNEGWVKGEEVGII